MSKCMNEAARTHVACPHCGATNRVPAARLGDDPVCGRCGQALLDGQPVELSDANFDARGRAQRPAGGGGLLGAVVRPVPADGAAFEQAAGTLKGRALLVKVNSDDNPRTASRFGIRSIPTLVKLRARPRSGARGRRAAGRADRAVCRRLIRPRAVRRPRGGQSDEPVHAFGIGHRVALEHAVGGGAHQQLLHRQLHLLARQGARHRAHLEHLVGHVARRQRLANLLLDALRERFVELAPLRAAPRTAASSFRGPGIRGRPPGCPALRATPPPRGTAQRCPCGCRGG